MRWILLILLMIGCGCRRPQEIPISSDTVSWKTLLSNVWTLEPQPFSSSKLFSSSSGSVLLTGYSSKTYGDLDHGSFLAVREIEGGFEATLAEVSGPGAITWIWSANPEGDLVLEIDGQEFVFSFHSFLSGEWLPVKGPFALKTAEGYNLHFPLIHRHHCKLSLRVKTRKELGALYYQVAWNGIDTKKTIEAFRPDRLMEEGRLLEQLSGNWKTGKEVELKEVFAGEIMPGEKKGVFRTMGRSGFQCLEISAASKLQLSGLGIELFWDDDEAPALSCPLHFLCGVSEKFENLNSIPVMVHGATATLRWPMAFEKGARIHLINSGPKKAAVSLSVSIDLKAEASGRLCGTFSNHWKLPLNQPNVLALADVPGSGTLVGCVVEVKNNGNEWWGEGDPLVYLNDPEHPAWRGTGTEDYFGFAWCSKARFQHPLRGQVRAGVMYRYHLLDTLPFNSGAWFDFEAHGSGAGVMDYSALVLWYSDIPSMNSDIVLK